MPFPPNTPVRYPKGVTNVDPRHPFFRLMVPDPTRQYLYSNDFDQYVAADWSLTGAGTPTAALTAGDGGVLLLSTTNANNDQSFIQKTPGSLILAAGQQAWFRCRIAMSNVTEPLLFAGLVNAGATAFSPTDGFWFSKATAATDLTFNYKTAAMGAAATFSITGLPATLPNYENPNAAAPFWPIANATMFELAVYYGGNTGLAIYYNDIQVGTIQINTTANPLPLASVLLAPAIGIQTKSGTVRTLSADFLQHGKTRY